MSAGMVGWSADSAYVSHSSKRTVVYVSRPHISFLKNEGLSKFFRYTQPQSEGFDLSNIGTCLGLLLVGEDKKNAGQAFQQRVTQTS